HVSRAVWERSRRLTYGGGMDVPSSRAAPAARVREAAELFGRDVVIDWCEQLLTGAVTDDDPSYPDISWLKGTIGWPDHWRRVWGARGLLHVGPPAHPEIVIGALDDGAWRVREMALKVIARHGLDLDGVTALVSDENERVRLQALRALGVPPSDR
ncbi:MAG: HEAT repeat domain-containing protein, partial [Microbacterium sp.]